MRSSIRHLFAFRIKTLACKNHTGGPCYTRPAKQRRVTQTATAPNCTHKSSTLSQAVLVSTDIYTHKRDRSYQLPLLLGGIRGVVIAMIAAPKAICCRNVWTLSYHNVMWPPPETKQHKATALSEYGSTPKHPHWLGQTSSCSTNNAVTPAYEHRCPMQSMHTCNFWCGLINAYRHAGRLDAYPSSGTALCDASRIDKKVCEVNGLYSVLHAAAKVSHSAASTCNQNRGVLLGYNSACAQLHHARQACRHLDNAWSPQPLRKASYLFNAVHNLGNVLLLHSTRSVHCYCLCGALAPASTYMLCAPFRRLKHYAGCSSASDKPLLSTSHCRIHEAPNALTPVPFLVLMGEQADQTLTHPWYLLSAI